MHRGKNTPTDPWSPVSDRRRARRRDVIVRPGANGSKDDSSSYVTARPILGALGAGGGTSRGPAGPAVRRGRGQGMYRLLIPSLGRGLLRAAGRRCGVCSARLLPGPAGGRAPEVQVPLFRVAPHGGGSSLLPLLAGEGRGPGGAGRVGTGARAGAGRAGTGARARPGDFRVPSHSARVVLEARCGRGGGGAAGSGRGRRRGCSGRGRGRDHPAAEASQGEAALLRITLSSSR